jgi:riboflavin biosynthesis pyrimidine reductase
VLGGADLAATFLRHDLIDEYRLYVHPIVLGKGQPMFQAPDVTINLRLAETRTFGNGVVLLRYERAGAELPEGTPGPGCPSSGSSAPTTR